MRARPSVYVVVIALSFGLSTVLTRLLAPGNNFVASVLDVVFVVAGVGILEGIALQRRGRRHSGGATLTLFFSDIVDSTGLLRRLGEGYGSMLARHEQLVRRAVADHAGTVVDTQGDALFAVFRRAGDAVAAARRTHESIARERWPGGLSVRVRVGVHTGDVRDEGGRYIGLPIHLAARICAAASAGETLVSVSTRALLPDDEAAVDAGEMTFHGFDVPVRVYALDELSAAPRCEASTPPFAGKEEELSAATRRAIPPRDGTT